MALKSRLRRTEERWISILEYLNSCVESVSTRENADYIGCDNTVTGTTLRQMEKKGLIRSEKVKGKKRWWVEKPAGLQYSLFPDTAPKGALSLKRVVRKARKLHGTDARKWISATMGKKAFATSGEVSQARITWEVADKILESFRGSPKDLRVKLSWGAGSTAEWKCGCKVVTSWKHARQDVYECGLPVCLRNVALSKQVSAPIPIAECAFTFTAPVDMPFGRMYKLTCGCSPVVARVVYAAGTIAKAGILAQGIGEAFCAKHRTRFRLV